MHYRQWGGNMTDDLIENPEDLSDGVFVFKHEGVKLPEWLRSVVLSKGRLFIPAAAAGPELAISLCAMSDCVPMAWHQGHTFLPLDWVRKEYSHIPKMTQVCDQIERRMGRSPK